MISFPVGGNKIVIAETMIKIRPTMYHYQENIVASSFREKVRAALPGGELTMTS